MNLFGIGNMEILIVLVVALMVLGPSRMVDMARSMGKLWNDAQRMLRAAADAATVKLDEPLSMSAPPRDPVPPPEDAISRPQPSDQTGPSEDDEQAKARD